MTAAEGTPAWVRLAKVAACVLAGAIAFWLTSGSGLTWEGRLTAAAGVMIGALWVTEALPLEATGLAPLVVFPVLGVATIDRAAAPYADPIIFLFLSGMILGQAMERWGLHRRLALSGLSVFGGGPSAMVAGVLVSTAFVSMWVSNTAAAVMMAPIAISIGKEVGDDGPAATRFRAALLLAVAFGASIGGVGSLIGTPPTAQFAAFMRQQMGKTVTFGEWLWVGVPVLLVLLPAAWLVLTRITPGVRGVDTRGAIAQVREARRALGAWTLGEKNTAGVFFAAGLGWLVTPLLARWSVIEDTPVQAVLTRIKDPVVGVACALSLFLIPTDIKRGEFTMTWRDAERVPWGVLLMFGGGLSLAGALSAHNVDVYLANLASPLAGAPLLLVLMVLSLGAVLLTEFASNTALVAAALPVVVGVGEKLGVPPAALMVTVTLSASLGFMMPAGTPPNALVYATGRVRLRQMMGAGAWLDLASAVLVPVLVWGCLRAGVLPGA